MLILTFLVLALSQSEGLTKGSDKGLLLEISALKTLYNGQFTLSTQLINKIIFLPLSSTNYVPSLTQHHSFSIKLLLSSLLNLVCFQVCFFLPPFYSWSEWESVRVEHFSNCFIPFSLVQVWHLDYNHQEKLHL